jgi:hypothetical protein
MLFKETVICCENHIEHTVTLCPYNAEFCAGTGGIYAEGRAIAEAISRRLPTAVARFRAWGVTSGICGGQIGVEAGFLLLLWFPLPKSFIPPTSLSSQSSGAGTIDQEWPQCRVDPVWTPTPNNQCIYICKTTELEMAKNLFRYIFSFHTKGII